MAITELRLERVRCIAAASLEPAAGLNLIVGGNGAGKTSLLEAIYLLGRGRSFRAPRTMAMIQSGHDAATVFARLRESGSEHRLGVALSRAGLEIHVDGRAGGSLADLVAGLPVQLMDPAVHELVQGGPGERRRFLDWGVFHVKHDFRQAWARYRRALMQRNAALRQGASAAAIRAWDMDLVEAGLEVDRWRRDYLAEASPLLAEESQALLGLPAAGHYRPGWAADTEFGPALQASLERDRAMGSTQVGPHRAEWVLEVDGEVARHRLSRGQQKLLAAALVLGQTRFVMAATERPLVLLVDEPAAELDHAHLAGLGHRIVASGAQVFMTALARDAVPGMPAARTFHVERGEVRTLI